MDQSLNILFIYKKKYHKKNKLVVSASKIKIWRYNIYQLSIIQLEKLSLLINLLMQLGIKLNFKGFFGCVDYV
jgi:hypothetical protein